MEGVPFFKFFQLLGGCNPLYLPVFFISRAVLKLGDIQLSENLGPESGGMKTKGRVQGLPMTSMIYI